jgi:hypothetical protein
MTRSPGARPERATCEGRHDHRRGFDLRIISRREGQQRLPGCVGDPRADSPSYYASAARSGCSSLTRWCSPSAARRCSGISDQQEVEDAPGHTERPHMDRALPRRQPRQDRPAIRLVHSELRPAGRRSDLLDDQRRRGTLSDGRDHPEATHAQPADPTPGNRTTRVRSARKARRPVRDQELAVLYGHL